MVLIMGKINRDFCLTIWRNSYKIPKFILKFITKESSLSRIVNPNTPGKERNRLKRVTALALRELLLESQPNVKTRDLVAFITLALEGISQTVEGTTVAWEKRDYWIKADRFRLEWEWAGRLGSDLRKAVVAENWDRIAEICAQIFHYVGNEKISEKHRMGEPWTGAWKEFHK